MTPQQRWRAKNQVHLANYRKTRRLANLAAERAKGKLYYATPRGKRAIRNSNLLKRNFTLTLFNQTMELQGYCCAICGVDLRLIPPRQVHADHCHVAEVPRGILCHLCNVGLGAFADDPVRLRAAADYLTNYPLRIV